MNLLPTDENVTQARSDELFDRLRLLGSATRTWLQFDRAELKRRVCDQVIAHFRAAPSRSYARALKTVWSSWGFSCNVAESTACTTPRYGTLIG